MSNSAVDNSVLCFGGAAARTAHRASFGSASACSKEGERRCPLPVRVRPAPAFVSPQPEEKRRGGRARERALWGRDFPTPCGQG
eukprot:gene19289-biopygen949